MKLNIKSHLGGVSRGSRGSRGCGRVFAWEKYSITFGGPFFVQEKFATTPTTPTTPTNQLNPINLTII